MGNTHLRLPTRKSLREYADENGHGSLDDAVVALLAEHRELLPTRRENALLQRLLNEANELVLDGVMPTRRK